MHEPPVTLTFGDPRSRDVVYAAALAQRAGSRHRWFPMRDGRWVLDYADLHLALTEGMHSWMHGHGMSTLDEARRLVDVNLSGWDGGTIMGGSIDFYRDALYRQAPSELDLAQRLFDAFCQRFTWPGLTEAEAASLSGGGACDWSRLAFDSVREELAATRRYRFERRADYFYIEQVLRRSLINQVVFTRSAIEVRCPYFDYPFVDFMYSLPDGIRTTPALRRAVLTRRLPRLATVPHEKDDRLPHTNPLRYHAHALVQRGKSWIHRHGLPVFPPRPRLYADYEEYLRTDLRDWAEAILFDPQTRERGLFDPTAVRALWERHLGGTELWTIGKIAPLITIELVLRALLDDATCAGGA
jgi:asparagine synthase (glutamine-hydrolysing)